jgi:hypothetical protein
MCHCELPQWRYPLGREKEDATHTDLQLKCSEKKKYREQAASSKLPNINEYVAYKDN